ncbi:MAG: LysR family transcriptional regulator [Kofleriaceae bacterium]
MTTRRVRTVWSWLPAFRTVAETQHLPTAAHELGVVPSSISRTVKQLEDELGVTLFDRTSKTLVLNDAGRRLVVAVREAMRLVDDALGTVIGDELRGAVGAVATSDIAQVLLTTAAAILAESSPQLVMASRIARFDDMADMLLRGEVDAAVMLEAPGHEDLRALELATWTRAVFMRAGPLEPGDHRCVIAGTPTDHVHDGWPPQHTRSVVAWAPDERSALELCARSTFATVAFDAVARASGLDARLVRVAELEIAPRTLYLVHRRAVGRHARTDALVDAIQHAARA